MSSEYAVLAPIYDSLGLGLYDEYITPKVIDFAQENLEWLGRRITVYGCGTGVSIAYLSQYAFNITGIDRSPEMLAQARSRLDSTSNIRWQEADVREVKPSATGSDMVLAVNLINELSSLRELESLLTTAFALLDTGKLLVCDLLTIEGLALSVTPPVEIIADDPQTLTAIRSAEFDYERQVCTTDYLIFQRQAGDWQRQTAQLKLRAFPVQAVASLLQRTRFQVRAILTTNFQIYDPAASRALRVIFFAEKL